MERKAFSRTNIYANRRWRTTQPSRARLLSDIKRAHFFFSSLLSQYTYTYTCVSSSPPYHSCARTFGPRANVRIYDMSYLGVALYPRTCKPTYPVHKYIHICIYTRTHTRARACTHVYTADTQVFTATTATGSSIEWAPLFANGYVFPLPAILPARL